MHAMIDHCDVATLMLSAQIGPKPSLADDRAMAQPPKS